MMQKFLCSRCGKRLWRKNARLIAGKLLCSTCMFAPPKRAASVDGTQDG